MEFDPYRNISRFYDRIMGEREDVDYVRRLLRRHRPKASTLLELACGTGTFLAELSKRYEVTGVDSSQAMAEIAEQSLLHADIHCDDMRRFSSRKRWDIVLCAFDSMNHLTRFTDWRRVFRVAHEHLTPVGIFVFDINTETKFENYIEETPFVDSLGEDFSIFDVSPGPYGRYHLDIRVFEQLEKGLFQEHRSCVVEKTFPTAKVKAELSKMFSKVTLYDEEFKAPSSDTESVYFVCEKS